MEQRSEQVLDSFIEVVQQRAGQWAEAARRIAQMLDAGLTGVTLLDEAAALRKSVGPAAAWCQDLPKDSVDPELFRAVEILGQHARNLRPARLNVPGQSHEIARDLDAIAEILHSTSPSGVAVDPGWSELGISEPDCDTVQIIVADGGQAEPSDAGIETDRSPDEEAQPVLSESPTNPATNPTGTADTVTAGPTQEPQPTLAPTPVQPPTQPNVELTQWERRILHALGGDSLIGRKIAEATGVHYTDPGFKRALASLRKREILNNERGRGYWIESGYRHLSD